MGTRGSVVAVAAAGVVLALGGCGGGTGEKTDASASEPAKPAQTRPPSGELGAVGRRHVCVDGRGRGASGGERRGTEGDPGPGRGRTVRPGPGPQLRRQDTVGGEDGGERAGGPRPVRRSRGRPAARRLAEEAEGCRVRTRRGVTGCGPRRGRGQCRGRRQARPVPHPAEAGPARAHRRRIRGSRPRTGRPSSAPRAGSQARGPAIRTLPRPTPPARCPSRRTARTSPPARTARARSSWPPRPTSPRTAWTCTSPWGTPSPSGRPAAS